MNETTAVTRHGYPMAMQSSPNGEVVRAPTRDQLWWHFHGANHQKNVFFLALAIRLAVVLLLLVFAESLNDLSRDSTKYEAIGKSIALEYEEGTNNFSQFIDHGWYQLVGLIFWIIGPYLVLVQLINCFLAAACAAILSRIAFLVTQDRSVTIFAGYTLALFPSFIWYSALPLKDACGIFALESVCLGILLLSVTRRVSGWAWLAMGLTILVSLRVYLVPVCIGCAALCLLPIHLPKGFLGFAKWIVASVLFAIGIILAIDAAGIEIDKSSRLFQYFDVAQLNNVRDGMNVGNAKLYTSKADSHYGQGIANDVWLFCKGLFFFFFTIDFTNVTRTRQLAATPEVLFFLLFLPYIYFGVVKGWNAGPKRVLPLILFGLALIVVYSSATTNMGAMYRWRMQAVPFLIVLIAYGALLWGRGPLGNILARIRASSV